PEGAPSNWVDAPGGRERLSPALSRRLAEAEASEAFQSRQADRERQALVQARQESAVLESWKDDVALGVAGIQDLAGYMAGRQGGRTRVEAIASAAAAQNREDARERSAVIRYGNAMMARLGPDVSGAALERFLYGDDREQS
ncbi:MAG TPA: hypothetical protein VIM17_12875, partial [Jatrophihabitantaceae bacterium]